MKDNIAATLDRCIEELRRGKTEEQCLAMYPAAAPDLAPLLRAANKVRTAPKVQVPDVAMRAGKAAFLQEAARLRAEKARRPTKPWQRLALVASTTFVLPRPRALAWTPALSVLLAIALILCTATTAVAASRSLPDEPLYAVKLASEQVQLALAGDVQTRADLMLSFTEKRLDEIATLTNLGRPVEASSIERLTVESQEALTTIARIEDDAMRPRLQRYLGIVAQQQSILTQVKPLPSVAEVVAAALAVAQQNEQLAETAIQDPSVIKETPPRTGRAPVAAPKDTPTPLPTPDPHRMRTPAATATETATPVPVPPTATSTLPPTPTRTATTLPPSPTATATVPPTATPLPRVQFSGVIEKVGAGEWVVDGRAVRIDGQTRIEGPGAARPGAKADVVAIVQTDGSYLALSIRVHVLSEPPVPPVTIHGIILAMSTTAWNVGGQTVAIDGSTAIAGTPALGYMANVTGWRKGSDTITATSITVGGPAPEVQIQGRIDRISGPTWVIGGQSVAIVAGLTSIVGTPSAGANALVIALRQDGGMPIAWRITVQAAATEEEFEGVINRIDGNTWVINGRRVTRGAGTQVDESQGRAQVGARARVRGTLQPDGTILAVSIRILAAGGSGRDTSPTAVASPTMVVSPMATPTPTMGVAPTRSIPPTATATQATGGQQASPTAVPPAASPTPRR